MNNKETRERAAAIQKSVEKCLRERTYNIEDIAGDAGYSRRQADRIMKEVFAMPLAKYVKARLLSISALTLKDHSDRILDLALEYGYSSEESFSRSFFSQFGVHPSQYKKEQTALAIFEPAKASDYDLFCSDQKGEIMSNRNYHTVTLYPFSMPASRWIILPSQNAECYFTFCQEKGCGWEAQLNSIPEKLSSACIIELPDFLSPSGRFMTVAAVQVPADYDKPLPEEYQYHQLPELHLLCAQSEPYANPDDFGVHIQSVFDSINRFDPVQMGFQWLPEKRPVFNFGASPQNGARIYAGIEPVIKEKN